MPQKPPRFDCHTIWLPSGDHRGLESLAGSNVNRSLAPVERSSTQISVLLLLGSDRTTAARLPSGEILSVLDRDGSTGVRVGFPWRSNQEGCSSRPSEVPVR